MAQVVDVCSISELPPGERSKLLVDGIDISVFNCEGTLYAIEDQCSHAEASLGEGDVDPATCTVECPRHGAKFDLKTGKALSLPAYAPIETFPVHVDDQMIKLEVS